MRKENRKEIEQVEDKDKSEVEGRAMTRGKIAR